MIRSFETDSVVILQNALDKAEEMESFHVRNLLDNHTIVIWGGGNRFRNGYKKYFLPNNIKVSYIVDINQELWGRKIAYSGSIALNFY